MTRTCTLALALIVAAVVSPTEAAAQLAPCANPEPPTNLTATIVAGRVRLTWTPPPPVDGCPVTSYRVGIGYQAGVANASELETPQTAIELSFTRGQFYARVASILANGQRGEYAADVQIIIPEPEPACLDRPIAVTNVSAASVGGGTTITWVAPTTGCPALGYLVLIGTSPGAQNDAAITTTQTSAFVEARTGISYAVVAPFNQEGLGPISDPATLNVSPRAPDPPPPPSPPCSPGRIPPPRNLRATVVGFLVDLFWDPPVQDCPTTGYRLSLATSANATPSTVIDLPPTSRSFFGELQPFDRFVVTVQAFTVAGLSPASNDVTVEAEPFAECVGPLTYTQAGSVVTFAWSPTLPNCQITQFILQAGRSRGSTEASIPLSPASRSLTVNAAGASGTWYVRVAAVVSGFNNVVYSNETRVVIP